MSIAQQTVDEFLTELASDAPSTSWSMVSWGTCGGRSQAPKRDSHQSLA